MSCRAKQQFNGTKPASFITFPNIVSINADPPANKLCVSVTRSLCKNCYKATVYNRWGEVMWETTNPADCWDGSNQKTKQPMPAGVYYISIGSIVKEGEAYTNHGNVTLVR